MQKSLITKGSEDSNPETDPCQQQATHQKAECPKVYTKPVVWGEICPSAPSAISTTMARVLKSATISLQREWVVFSREEPGHFKRDCPKFKNKDRGNGNAQGWVYAVGNAENRRMHPLRNKILLASL
ncbi:putative reverse transcriptase domain-containing protein [Tanacetum coccineum]